MSLTKEDIRAIRRADTMVFMHNGDHGLGARGPWLKTVKEVRQADGSIDFVQNQEHWIRLASTGVHTYEGGWNNEERKPYPTQNYEADRLVGSVVLQTLSQRQDVWTWAKSLHEGDDLVVTFLVGNNSENLIEAGLSKDEAWLQIHRNTRLVGKYFLDSTIVPVWSTARMVRPLLTMALVL
jgi:hypothetical protein